MVWESGGPGTHTVLLVHRPGAATRPHTSATSLCANFDPTTTKESTQADSVRPPALFLSPSKHSWQNSFPKCTVTWELLWWRPRSHHIDLDVLHITLWVNNNLSVLFILCLLAFYVLVIFWVGVPQRPLVIGLVPAHGTLGRWWNLQGLGPTWRPSGQQGCVLKGDMRVPAPSSLPSWPQATDLSPPCTPSYDLLSYWRPKTWRAIDHRLELWPKLNLFFF